MPLRLMPGTTPCVYRSTEYVERDESPRGSYKMNAGQVIRHIAVDWGDREQAELDFGGDVVVLNAVGLARYLSRTTPHPFPPKPWMYVSDITDEMPVALRGNNGLTAGGLAVAEYDMCELTLAYQMPSYNIKEDTDIIAPTGPLEGYPDEGYFLALGHDQWSRYVSKIDKHATKTLVLNKGMLKDENNNLVVEGIPFPEPAGEIQYVWHQVPRSVVPHLRYEAFSNVVNDATFDGHAPGTLLFEGSPDIRYGENTVTGKYLCDITYKFKVSKKFDPVDSTIKGHNYIYRLVDHPTLPTKILRPLLVSVSGGPTPDEGSMMFRPYDFANFFRPADTP